MNARRSLSIARIKKNIVTNCGKEIDRGITIAVHRPDAVGESHNFIIHAPEISGSNTTGINQSRCNRRTHGGRACHSPFT